MHVCDNILFLESSQNSTKTHLHFTYTMCGVANCQFQSAGNRQDNAYHLQMTWLLQTPVQYTRQYHSQLLIHSSLLPTHDILTQ